MIVKMKGLGALFLTGYVQVVLVTVNMWQIANNKHLTALPVAFAISFLWTLNVKQVAFGKLLERLIYSGGAMAGCLSGMILSRLVYV